MAAPTTHPRPGATSPDEQPTQPLQVATRPADWQQPQPVPPQVVIERPRRGPGSGLGLALGAVLCVLFLIVGAMVGWFGDQMRDFLFPPEQGPSVGDVALLEIHRTAELQAATGTFSVPVYFGQEEDQGIAGYIPDLFDGDSGVAIYQGSVDVTIDLAGLSETDVEADADAGTLALTVPSPVLGDPNIDEAESSVIDRDRGLGVRISDFFADDPSSMREDLDDAAVAALTQAADDAGLVATAEESGRDFLTALGHQLGFETVTVTYE